MTDHDQRMREAFAALSQGAAADDACPSSETLRAAVQGQLPAAAVEEIVSHTARCAACAEDWRISLGFVRAMADSEPAHPPAKVVAFPARRWLAPLAAAAAILLAVLVFRPQPSPEPPIYRDQNTKPAIRSLIPEQTSLRRDDCVLRWACDDAGPGTRYEVQVTTADVFEMVAHVRDLDRAELRLSSEQLARVSPGGPLLWWVRATTADGTMRQSATFRQELEP